VNRFLCCVLIATFGFVIVACGPQSGSTGSSSVAPTATQGASIAAAPTTPPTIPAASPIAVQQATAPQATTAPATKVATLASTPAAAATTAVTAAATAPASAANPVSGGQITLSLVPADSEARFLVKEQLAEKNLPGDAVGKTNAITGTLVIGTDGKIVSGQSLFVVQVGKLQTDSGMRDRFIQGNVMQVSRFPTATFRPTEARSLPATLPSAGDVKFQLAGDLTIHGVTKPVVWDVTGTVSGKNLKGTAKTAVTFGDFGMTPPRVPVVLSVEDNIRLEIDFHLTAS